MYGVTAGAELKPAGLKAGFGCGLGRGFVARGLARRAFKLLEFNVHIFFVNFLKLNISLSLCTICRL